MNHDEAPAQRLSRPPPLSLIRWLLGVPFTQAIYVAAELGLPDHLADGPQSCGQLAAAVGAEPGSLMRLLRMLVNTGIVAYADEEKFALTATGRHLQSAESGSLRDLARLGGAPWHLKPWTELLHAVKTGEPSFDRLHGMKFYEYLSQNPPAARLFDNAMTSVVGRFAVAVADVCDLSGAGTIVDVGGGSGTLLATLLEKNPDAKGVLFDMETAIEASDPILEGFAAAGRCTRVIGDFFEEVPKGADVYVLSHVLHNWDNVRAAAILRNCRKAMQTSSRLLIIELFSGPGQDLYASWLDLEMLVNFGGRERSEAEYRRLVEEVGLALANIIATQSPVRVMECRSV